MWHVSSRSGVATLRTAIHLLLTYLLTKPHRMQSTSMRYGYAVDCLCVSVYRPCAVRVLVTTVSLTKKQLKRSRYRFGYGEVAGGGAKTMLSGNPEFSTGGSCNSFLLFIYDRCLL